MKSKKQLFVSKLNRVQETQKARLLVVLLQVARDLFDERVQQILLELSVTLGVP